MFPGACWKSSSGARKGNVKSITHGAVNSEAVVELPGGRQVMSVITKDSATQLGLAVGKEVYAVIKASDVMLAVD